MPRLPEINLRDMDRELVELEAAAEPRKAFPFYRRVAFGTANFTTLLAVSMWFTYNVGFYQNVLQLPPKSAGTIILVAQIGGALSTPFIGVWSDDCRCRTPGRRKIFQLIGVFSVVVSFFFVWHECLGCSAVPVPYKVIYYSSFAIVFEFGRASAQIGQLALIPELTSDKNIQVELNSIRYVFSVLANLLMFGCFWILLERMNHSLDLSDLSPNDKPIFWIMSLVVICVGAPVSLTFQFCIQENSELKPPALKRYQWFLNPKFYLAACGYAAARLMIILPQTYIPLYFLNTLHMDKSSIAKGPLVLYITGFIVALIVKRCSKFLGAKMMFFVGIAIVWGALIWFWIAEPSSSASTKVFQWPRDSIYGALVLLGAGGAIVHVISMTLAAYAIGPYTGSGAFVYGWVAFADKLSYGMAVKIIQQMQPLQSSQLPNFYRHVLVFAPFTGSALGLFMITSLLIVGCYENRKTLRFRGHPLGIQSTKELDYGATKDTDYS